MYLPSLTFKLDVKLTGLSKHNPLKGDTKVLLIFNCHWIEPLGVQQNIMHMSYSGVLKVRYGIKQMQRYKQSICSRGEGRCITLLGTLLS